MDLQDEEVKKICETGRSSASVSAESTEKKWRQVFDSVTLGAKRLAISDRLSHSTFYADDDSDPTEQAEGHRKKCRKKGGGLVHDLSREKIDAPNTTPHTKSTESVMNEIMSVTTEYIRKQNDDTSFQSSSSSSSRRAENDDLTFAQRIQLEEMKGENLKLQYEIMSLEKSLKDAAWNVEVKLYSWMI